MKIRNCACGWLWADKGFALVSLPCCYCKKTLSQLSSAPLPCWKQLPEQEEGGMLGKIFQHWWVHFGGLELGMENTGTELPWVWAAPWTLMNNGAGHSKSYHHRIL